MLLPPLPCPCHSAHAMLRKIISPSYFESNVASQNVQLAQSGLQKFLMIFRLLMMIATQVLRQAINPGGEVNIWWDPLLEAQLCTSSTWTKGGQLCMMTAQELEPRWKLRQAELHGYVNASFYELAGLQAVAAPCHCCRSCCKPCYWWADERQIGCRVVASNYWRWR